MPFNSRCMKFLSFLLLVVLATQCQDKTAHPPGVSFYFPLPCCMGCVGTAALAYHQLCDSSTACHLIYNDEGRGIAPSVFERYHLNIDKAHEVSLHDFSGRDLEYTYPTIVVNHGGQLSRFYVRPRLDLPAVMDSIRTQLAEPAAEASM